MYNNKVKITYNKAKNQQNIEKHGVRLADAELLDWDLLIASIDARKDYGEVRMIGYAPINNRVYCVVFVDRDDSRRIISFRKANRREVTWYEQKI